MRDNEEIIRRIFKILCSYKEQPEALRDFLRDTMQGEFYPERKRLYEYGSVVTDAIFVSSGYVACYGFDERGDRQLISILGQDVIVAGKSFTEQSPSEFEFTALPGAYLMTISHKHMAHVYANFPDAEELARLIMADNGEKAQKRLQQLKRDAESVVFDFYKKDFPEFYPPGRLIPDTDIGSYLLISESTLRNVRAKLIREGRII